MGLGRRKLQVMMWLSFHVISYDYLESVLVVTYCILHYSSCQLPFVCLSELPCSDVLRLCRMCARMFSSSYTLLYVAVTIFRANDVEGGSQPVFRSCFGSNALCNIS
jgi:hypothetical protein